jgi:hypothetical protein
MNALIDSGVPLLVERGDDWYYVGPIEPAMRLMADSVTEVRVVHTPVGWRTHTVDYNGTQATEHEWGNALTSVRTSGRSTLSSTSAD